MGLNPRRDSPYVMGFPIGSTIWALEARIDVAMAHSSWAWYALGKTADARLQIVAANIPGCVLWKKHRIVSAKTMNLVNLSRKVPLVIREKRKTMRNFVRVTSEYYIHLHCTGECAAMWSIADFPEGKAWVVHLSKAQLVIRGVCAFKSGEERVEVTGRAHNGTCAGANQRLRVLNGADVAGVNARFEYIDRGGNPDAPPTLAARSDETPPPNGEAIVIPLRRSNACCTVPPRLALDLDDQAACVAAALRARFSSERSQSVQKDEEILLLKTQLADAQAEAESSRSYAQNLAEEKMALLVKVEQERANSADYKASCHWAVKYLEGGKNNHFAGLDEFRQRVEELLEKQEEKLRKLSIEYDEELYPHMLSAIAERRWLISHGLRLAAMSTLESQEVKQSFGDVVKCALARGKAEAVEELHEKKLLTVPAAQVPGYNDNAYEELVAAMEAMKLLELPHIAQLERDQDYPIDVIMAGEIPLKETLEAHAIRLAKKKGVKGKAILCGVGAAHIPVLMFLYQLAVSAVSLK
ncbi:hypothetical protein Tco_0272510 [Tanacetum coccineum]